MKRNYKPDWDPNSENAMNYGLDVAYSGDGFTGVVSTSGADIAGLACAASADVDASKDVRYVSPY